MSLAGRAFVVTGGASGIGRATVNKLLQLSATVHAVDKATTITNNTKHNCKLFTYPGIDIGSRQQMTKVFDKISEQSPTPLRGLAHCAAILAPSPTSAEGDEGLERLWTTNVLGTWITSTEFRRCLQKSPGWASMDTGASIVNVGSMASLRGIPGLSGYVASKHGVLGLTRSLAQEWGPEGIRINCVTPGTVMTPMVQGMLPSGDAKPLFHIAGKQVADPEEIADTILYLLSDQSSNIFGTVIETNGGWA
ncbi:hypothetical protein VF21_07979 [Pseudogymnoascus sp. 05NY08]|nr:hypothetical protein VF21_07979 [Pseudogymnoascus sp. 05NY08]